MSSKSAAEAKRPRGRPPKPMPRIDASPEAVSLADGHPRVRVFREDCAFRSPSAAAAVVNGRPANGRLEWKVRGLEKTHADWDNERLGVG